MDCQIIPVMKWSNCVLMTLWFSDGMNYIKSDNNTIMLLVPGEHNYRQISD
jgi:hypothetical protein